tara:strand:+ start:6992 stop:7957 length:966 start_codon:yes stop_codon:yes gene_type:complete
MKSRPIVIVAGEPRSVFLEIFFKSIKKKKFKSPIILICCKKLLIREMKINNFKKKIKEFEIKDLKKIKLNNNFINLINVRLLINSKKENHNKLINIYINQCLKIGFKIIQKKFTNKFVNGPINKSTFLSKKYLGMTELISKHFNQKNTGMLIYNNKLSVSPITTHLPIKLVSKKINKKIVKKNIEIIHSFFKNIIKKKARIAVAGLNPHCESILSFNEDKMIIEPIIKKLNKKGIDVEGPYPADTLFLKKNRQKYNVIIGAYHDQVLGPFKTLFEYDAINITIGLPFLRVSPDHGPNLKMYGKKKSNALSLIKCLEFLDKQ